MNGIKKRFQWLTSLVGSDQLPSKEHFEKMRKLQKNKDAVLTRSDKGAGIIIPSRQYYINKVTAVSSFQFKFTQNKE